MSTPTSPLPLPHVMALVSSSGAPVRTDAGNALRDWHESASNLCVIYGRVGSGKSTLLRDFVAQSNGQVSAVGDFESYRVNPHDTDRSTLILDNFDSVNSITGQQTSYPDLSSLSQSLERGCRLIVATRREPSDSSDELVAQLSSPLRSERLHAIAPFTVSLQPWTLDELESWASTEGARDGVAHRTVAYLSRHREMLGEDFRGPLTLGMLMQVHDRLPDRGIPITIAQLFDEYAKWALSLDYDLRRSGFRERHKRQILSNIAYDVFSGAPGTEPRFYAASRNRLAERVMEIVTQDPMIRATIPDPQYAWLQDFIDTNHVLVPMADQALDVQSRRFQFVHPSLFEYFVAEAVLARLRAGSSLGIRPAALSEATFRSMVLYFVGEQLTSEVEAVVAGLASRRLSWPDRLLLLYTMEMSPHLEEMLRGCGRDYFEDLEENLQLVQAPFVQKAMKYQLILAGRYDSFAYVDEVRRQEEATETAAERWLHARASFDPTASLLARLSNPVLREAAPVAVYRLGQMGGPEGLAALLAIVDDEHSSSQLRSLAQEAADRIEERASLDGDGRGL